MLASSLMVLSLVVADGAVPDAAVSPPAPAMAPLRAPAAPPAVALAPLPGVALERPAPTRWYGWELMLSDAAFATIAWRSGWNGAGLMAAVFGTLGTPMLHVVNGNGRQGMRSIVVRSATWLTAWLAVVVETAVNPCHGDSCLGTFDFDTTLPLAVLAAGAVFVLVDDTFLATAPAAPDPGRQIVSARSFAPARWVPTLSPTPGGATMGLHGVF